MKMIAAKPLLLCAPLLLLIGCSSDTTNAAEPNATEATPEAENLMNEAAGEIDAAAKKAADAIEEVDADAELDKLKKEMDSDG